MMFVFCSYVVAVSVSHVVYLSIGLGIAKEGVISDANINILNIQHSASSC